MSLTNEDKLWITEQLTAHSNVLTQHTRLEIGGLETRLKDYTHGQIEQLETKLLTEFQKWASPLENRMRVHRAAMQALDSQIDYVDDRLKKLEHPSQNLA